MATTCCDLDEVPTHAGEQEYPSVAALGKTFMVAWTHAGNIYMNGNWILFADGFESGSTNSWSATAP